MPVRALRGATTVEADTERDIRDRVGALVAALFERNDLTTDVIISAVVTATSDLCSYHPATAARAAGLTDVPILGAQELDIDGMLPRCVRLLLHIDTERSKAEVEHVFLEGAVVLRPDLARP